MEERDRYGHVRDEEYHLQVERALQRLYAAASATAIDHYAMEKLTVAAQAIEAARRALVAVDRFPMGDWTEGAQRALTTINRISLAAAVLVYHSRPPGVLLQVRGFVHPDSGVLDLELEPDQARDLARILDDLSIEALAS